MKINGNLIKDLIAKHQTKKSRMINLYKRYKGEGLNIELKEGSQSMNVNNIIKNNYRKVIVDQSVGYLFGVPMSISLDDANYEEHLYQRNHSKIQRFLKLNNFNDVIAETEKIRACSGYSAWLVYRDTSSEIRMMQVDAWNTIFIENEQGEIILALRFYDVEVETNKGKQTRTKTEVFDNTNLYYYIEDEKGNYLLDGQEAKNPRPHRFKYVPLVKIKNNEEEIGDFEQVETLIDAYDYNLSSVQDEIEAFRMAYLAVYGAEIDEEVMLEIKKTGIFQIPRGLEGENDVRLEFITKQINDVLYENQKKTLNDNIYKFSSSIDMSDERFSGGGESGESRKWKLISLENKAIIKERKMETALNQLFKIVCSGWEIEGLNIDYLDIFYSFKRNLPIDLLYLGEVANKFKGVVSEDTRLGLLNGVVDDIEYEKRKMKEDMEGNIDFNSLQFNEDEEVNE